jgi:magnesium transporter
MIVDCAVYRHGSRVNVDRSEDLAAAASAVRGDEGFVWVGLHEPSAEELERVASVFGLHRLAVEDAVHAHQRPKLERYDDDLFIVLKTLWYVDATDAVETGEIALFVGDQYVVSVRHGAGAGLSATRRDLEQRAAVLGHGPAAVVYAVCDRVVDEYEQVAAALEVDVDEIEQSVFSPERTSDAQRIYLLKREMQEFRRAVGPLREPMARLSAGVVPSVPKDAAPFFRDVHDHAVRVFEQVSALDDLLTNALTAHLAQISLQQNDDMRKISAWIAIAALPTMVAGIYGMNFRYMPELQWRLGYPLVLGVLVVACTALYRFFKKAGWL